MQKNYVFDTNVLLHDPYALLKFQDNNVVIPITVIEELDKFKRDMNTLGRNAREATRLIDQHRSKGNLQKGVALAEGGSLRVMTNLGKEPPLPFPTLGKTADSLILATALRLRKEEPETPVVFVTRDINLRLRADAVGLKAEDYEESQEVTDIEEMYTGRTEASVSRAALDQLVTRGSIDNPGIELRPNQCVVLHAEDDSERHELARNTPSGQIRLVSSAVQDVYGISPRNDEQALSLDLLLDDKISLVTLVGKAGTGKTLLAIAAGMRKVAQDGVYNKLVVARPIMPLGRELGFLPGDVGEKLRPWMEPVFDNLELILKLKEEQGEPKSDSGKGHKRRKSHDTVQQLVSSGMLEIEPLTYIRGRSLPDQYLIIDEAQNLTSHEVKTIVSRAGEGTKVVLTGDPYQIDNPFLDSGSNGLSIAVERFKDQALAGHMTLVRGERSELAALASDLL